MNPGYVELLVERLVLRDIQVTPGLSDEEVARVEHDFGFRLPVDLRELLQTLLPVGEDFPDWRSDSRLPIEKRLNWPVEGLLFDVERQQLWIPDWGDRPASPEAAVALARERLEDVPRLIPIYGNRYLPAEPSEPGNPVFSIQQSDIICYGADLASYLQAEFGVPDPNPIPRRPRIIRFWSQLLG